MDYRCPGCKKKIAKEDRRKSNQVLKPLAGASVFIRKNEAIRIKCLCGKVIIILKGSL